MPSQGPFKHHSGPPEAPLRLPSRPSQVFLRLPRPLTVPLPKSPQALLRSFSVTSKALLRPPQVPLKAPSIISQAPFKPDQVQSGFSQTPFRFLSALFRAPSGPHRKRGRLGSPRQGPNISHLEMQIPRDLRGARGSVQWAQGLQLPSACGQIKCSSSIYEASGLAAACPHCVPTCQSPLWHLCLGPISKDDNLHPFSLLGARAWGNIQTLIGT